jgi:hypothetical protein
MICPGFSGQYRQLEANCPLPFRDFAKSAPGLPPSQVLMTLVTSRSFDPQGKRHEQVNSLGVVEGSYQTQIV